MKLKSKDIILDVSVEELETISNALNEVCHALDLHEFETRIGVSMEEAGELLTEISEMLRKV